MDFCVPTITTDDLAQFHASHFSGAPLPTEHLSQADYGVQEEYYDADDDGLGYYEDGVKRTLTDEQIAMFRHSEIHRILLERRRRKEAGEPYLKSPSFVPMDASLPTEALRAASPASAQSTPMSISSDDEGATEKPQQKWTAISEKSRARNARNRTKNRKNHRARKKEERKRKEQEQKEKRHEDEESDEWDPWHQAKGPDVQKSEVIDLAY